MNKTSIEWCDYTWNPVVGCGKNCYYCYARKMNDRFKFIPDWNKPQFFEERLQEPSKLKKPSTIFVGSMCDLFGENIPNSWIQRIIDEAHFCKYQKFMFLTKNPIRYNEFEFPNNCKLGMTATKGEDINMTGDYYWTTCNHSFVSIEPLLGSFTPDSIEMFDLVIVGAMTGKNPVIPQKEWIESIKHHNIFYKNNIKRYLC